MNRSPRKNENPLQMEISWRRRESNPRDIPYGRGCIACPGREGLVLYVSRFGIHSICPGCLPQFKRDYVYLISDDLGRVKIGHSRNPESRLKDLCNAAGRKLRLLSCRLGGQPLEYELHQRFKSLRLNGEWFADSAEIRAAFGVAA